MHEYRSFIRAEMDALGIDNAELVRRSGLRRQLIWKILNDDRDSLGQMPDESTIEGLARGLGVSPGRVRTAAARSLAGYSDDGGAITTDLSQVSIDVLLTEIRRRVVAAPNQTKDSPGTGLLPDNWSGAGEPPALQDPGVDRHEESVERHELFGQ